MKSQSKFIHFYSTKMHLKKLVLKMSAILSRPQCVNSSSSCTTYLCHWTWSPLAQIMACRLLVQSHYIQTKHNFSSHPKKKTSMGQLSKLNNFHRLNCNYMLLSANWLPLYTVEYVEYWKGACIQTLVWHFANGDVVNLHRVMMRIID